MITLHNTVFANQNICIYIQTKDTHETHYDGFPWGGEKKEVSCGYKREAEKKTYPKGSKKHRYCKIEEWILSGQKKPSVYCLKNVQEIRTSKVDSNRQSMREDCVNTNLGHRALTSFIVIIKSATQRPGLPPNVEKMASYLNLRRRFGKHLQNGFWNIMAH